MTAPIHCLETGKTQQAQVYVSAMGLFGYIYAVAAAMEKG